MVVVDRAKFVLANLVRAKLGRETAKFWVDQHFERVRRFIRRVAQRKGQPAMRGEIDRVCGPKFAEVGPDRTNAGRGHQSWQTIAT